MPYIVPSTHAICFTKQYYGTSTTTSNLETVNAQTLGRLPRIVGCKLVVKYTFLLSISDISAGVYDLPSVVLDLFQYFIGLK